MTVRCVPLYAGGVRVRGVSFSPRGAECGVYTGLYVRAFSEEALERGVNKVELSALTLLDTGTRLYWTKNLSRHPTCDLDTSSSPGQKI